MTDDLDTGTLRFADLCFEAARNGGTEQLAGLLDAGLSPNLATAGRDTLLMLAAKHAHPDTVRLLLDRGADHSRVNDRGQTPLSAVGERCRSCSTPAPTRPGPAVGVRGGDYFRLPAMAALLGASMP